MVTTPLPSREPRALNRILPESEIVMLNYGLFTPKKRGRPLKYGPPASTVTQELARKRESIPLGALNLAGTIISMLLKGHQLNLQDVESLHKIYLLRKRYLSVVGLRMETKSQLSNLFLPKSRPAQQVHSYEDHALEECWRNVADLLTKKDREMISLIDCLFKIHAYDDLQETYTRFIKEKDRDLSQAAKLCEEVWSRQRRAA